MTEILPKSHIEVELIEVAGGDESIIHAAKVSTLGQRSEDDETLNPKQFLSFLMKNRHGSPFEHGMFTWRVHAPIFVWREHHRHRIGSYNEESGRYKQLEPVFYVPAEDRNLIQVGRPGKYTYELGNAAHRAIVISAQLTAYQTAYDMYEQQLEAGIAKEVARMVLPTAIFSTCYVTMNPRALMNFLSLRTKHPDSTYPSYPMREIEMVAEQYELDFARHYPITSRVFTEHGRVAP